MFVSSTRRVRIALYISLAAIFVVALSISAAPGPVQAPAARNIPRTADGKPNLQGIWKANNKAATDLLDMTSTAGKSVVEGNQIPYLPAAATKKQQNFANRKTADPLEKCFMPGVPRIMYLNYPFQIFQTKEHVAITFEWSQVYRLVYLTGAAARTGGLEFWMGDSRGHWDGDTLVVDVTNNSDQTWFDAAGNYHSEALRLTERYSLLNADTIQYEVTVHDPKVFSKDWKIAMPLQRQKNMTRILEYQCQAEKEEANGAFERDPRTWYPKK
jgi:hypothetical protein